MFRASIHFPQEIVVVEFESDYAFVKWLGYLKEHGVATIKLAGREERVVVFHQQICFIELTAADAHALDVDKLQP